MSTLRAVTVTIVNLLGLKLVHGDTECWDASSCSEDTVIEKGNLEGALECSGSWSCLKSNVTNVDLIGNSTDRETECSGLRACQEATSVSVLNRIAGNEMNAEIDGYLGLAWASKVKVVHTPEDSYDYGELDCTAEGACVGVSLVSEADQIACGGLRSCNDIEEAYVGRYLEAYGSFDLMNSVFYSNPSDDSDTVYVELYGFFSGYDGTFYCESGHTCDVECGINGCVGFNYHCDDSATCTCDCDDVDILCPNGWEDGSYTGDFSGDASGELDIFSSNEIIENAFDKEYSSDQDYEIDNECGENCNDYIECFFDDISISDKDYCCNGASSCGFSDVTSSGDRDIYCNGGASCGGTDFDMNDQSGSNIYLRGGGSGVIADIANFDKIESSGATAISLADVENGDRMYCYGYSSCTWNDIYGVSKIYALGYFSLFWADIFSNGTDIDIYLLGYNSGYWIDLTCQGTDTCTIYGLTDDYGGIDTDDVSCDPSNACTINYVVIDDSSELADTDTSGDSDSGGGSDSDSPAPTLMTKCSYISVAMVLLVRFFA